MSGANEHLHRLKSFFGGPDNFGNYCRKISGVLLRLLFWHAAHGVPKERVHLRPRMCMSGGHNNMAGRDTSSLCDQLPSFHDYRMRKTNNIQNHKCALDISSIKNQCFRIKVIMNTLRHCNAIRATHDTSYGRCNLARGRARSENFRLAEPSCTREVLRHRHHAACHQDDEKKAHQEVRQFMHRKCARQLIICRIATA